MWSLLENVGDLFKDNFFKDVCAQNVPMLNFWKKKHRDRGPFMRVNWRPS